MSAMATPDTSVDLTASELAAWRGMLRVHTALVKALDAELAAAHDLPLSSYEVLITLESAPGRKRRMAELADSVLLSRSGMTRLVDRLAKEELLERDLCTDDGRGCYAVLTEKGAELLATARPNHLDGVRERFLRHFSQDELVMLAGMWERVLPGAVTVPD
jgi:DNA-binding MarR family transcriptional regulator